MSELMSDAINLMFVGMGFVYMFLMVLVFTTSFMSKLVARFAPKEPDNLVTNPNHDSIESTPVDHRLVAVISAALAKYRSQHQK